LVYDLQDLELLLQD